LASSSRIQVMVASLTPLASPEKTRKKAPLKVKE
jgi:hypothetical protein